VTNNGKAARLEGIRTKLAEGEYYGLAITDITWLGKQLETTWDIEAEVTKLRAWHKSNLELIGQQAEIIQRANAKLAEMSREISNQAELLRQAGIHLNEMQQQSYGQGQ
jgi:hypothetical protein